MKPVEPNEPKEPERDPVLSSPYGPHPGPVDEVSGGADSSPLETLSSAERHELLQRARKAAEGGG